jgi:hypothetical protein
MIKWLRLFQKGVVYTKLDIHILFSINKQMSENIQTLTGKS